MKIQTYVREPAMSTIFAYKDSFRKGLIIDTFPWTYFAMTFGFTWLICLPGVLSSRGVFTLPFPNILLAAIAQFGPSLTAFILVYRSDGKAGVRQLVKRALNFRIPVRWLVPTFFLPLILAGSATYLHVVTGGQPPPLQLLFEPAAILPTFLLIFFLQGPVPEEFGWRGYALDRLQDKWNALTSSLILGVFWAVWHLPLFYMEGVVQSFLPLWPYLILVVAFSVLTTWLYNNTGGNLLVALLFHTMINLSIALFPPVEMMPGSDQRPFIYLTFLYVIAALLVVVIWRSRKMSRH